jgi:hypothetical protein
MPLWVPATIVRRLDRRSGLQKLWQTCGALSGAHRRVGWGQPRAWHRRLCHKPRSVVSLRLLLGGFAGFFIIPEPASADESGFATPSRFIPRAEPRKANCGMCFDPTTHCERASTKAGRQVPTDQATRSQPKGHREQAGARSVDQGSTR